MKKIFLVPLIILVVSAFVFGGCAAPAPAPAPTPEKPIELKFAHWIPPMATPITAVFVPWAGEVEEATAAIGKPVKITFYHAGAMGGPEEHYDLCVSGAADITQVPPQYTPGVFPLSEITGLPMIGIPSAEAHALVVHKLYEKYLMDTEWKDVKVLWMLAVTPTELQTTKKHVRTLEDLKGMRLLVTQASGVKAAELLGASGMLMPEPEKYEAVERGLADGIFREWEGAVTFRTYELTKYRTGNVGFGASAGPIVMNLDSWNSLPPEVQKIFEQTTGLELSMALGRVFDESNAKCLEEIIEYDKKAGNPEIYYLPDAEKARWREAISPVVDDWVGEMESKGLPARALLESLYALLEEYSQ